MTQHPPPDLAEVQLSISWKAILDRINRASPPTRRAFRGLVATIAVAVIVAIVDAATGSPGQEPFRLIAVVLAACAFVVRALGALLQQMTIEADSLSPAPFTQALPGHAAPELNAIAAVLFGIASGLVAPSILHTPVFAIVPPVLLALAWISARDVIRATTSLQSSAFELAISAERARSEAVAARLAALRAQMDPHFLFNALNTVASLVRTDAQRAEKVVESLAGVLRKTLTSSQKTLGTVRDEVELVRDFLTIEQERWGGALRVVWDVEEGAMPVQLPTMSLQPLVENALHHGIGARMEGGELQIAARSDAARTTLTVRDNGPALQTPVREGTGIGNLRRRLQELYGTSASLTLTRDGAWTVAVLRLPTARAKGG